MNESDPCCVIAPAMQRLVKVEIILELLLRHFDLKADTTSDYSIQWKVLPVCKECGR